MTAPHPTQDAPELPGYAVAPMGLDDAADWAVYALRPEVMRFTSSTATSVDDLRPMIERTRSGDANAPLLFAVRAPGSHELVATVGFHTVSALNRSAEITYTVHPAHWGRGLATMACDAAVRWAFARRGWVRVQATTLEAHHASQRVLLKCGFEFEGRLRHLRIVRGQPCDFLLYARVPPPG